MRAHERVRRNMLKNYEDSKCVYGYMTVCNECKEKAPAWVNIEKEIKGYPTPKCEICGKTGQEKGGEQ